MERKDFIRKASVLSLGMLGAGKIRAHSTAAESPEIIINAGVAGNTTKNLLARISTDCLQHKPTLVIMMIGTNDMNHGKYIPLPGYKENLELLADTILKNGS
ncbi:SGNH/GDSL hydrolase family protein, partial [Parafilimonas sp.]|uniref:SGNH/GDSL hydrolase family protein n=1 Tax=Parafilimonas sp. TaxID=1969739 RepID=UPI0039E55304